MAVGGQRVSSVPLSLNTCTHTIIEGKGEIQHRPRKNKAARLQRDGGINPPRVSHRVSGISPPRVSHQVSGISPPRVSRQVSGISPPRVSRQVSGIFLESDVRYHASVFLESVVRYHASVLLESVVRYQEGSVRSAGSTTMEPLNCKTVPVKMIAQPGLSERPGVAGRPGLQK
ncbi:UNVERIFIED_CONTAM: hypothetical protein FKN15_043461 [Acipenser sinensis]